MQRTDKVAIGKVILREREDPVVISATPEGLIIQTLRYAREVRNFSALPTKAGTEVSDEELELAATLVERMITTFDQIDLTDHYFIALREMLDRKIAGEEITQTQKPTQPDKVVDIMAALRASLSINKQTPEPASPVESMPAPAQTEDGAPTLPLLTLDTESKSKTKRRRAA